MNKMALCVGINKFKNYPESTLHGCVNDAKDMSKFFTSLGVKDITFLSDELASKESIVNELKRIIEKAEDGDKIFFSMSSHGTQIPDNNGDEDDRMDEAFVPYDLAENKEGFDLNYLISDDELATLFNAANNGVTIEVFLDTCHSGTGVRDFNTHIKEKYIPFPGKIEKTPRKSNMNFRKVDNELVLWAGCKANQTSADAYINNDYHGAFTFYFLESAKGKGKRSKIIKQTQNKLKSRDYDQVPALECEDEYKSKVIGD